MENEYVQLGKIIRERRKKIGLTLSLLAKRSKTDETTIREIERGKRNPRIYTLYKISQGLNISLFKLLKGIS